MRSSHPDLVPYVRGYNTARDYIEALVIERNADGSQRAHIRDTKTEWGQGDLGASDVDGGGSARFTAYDDGTLRLKDTTTTLLTRTSHPNNVTDLNRIAPLEAGIVEWRGPEPPDFDLLRAKFWLNPRVSGSQRREVVRWRLELYALTDYYMDVLPNLRDGVYVPIAEPLDVLVTGDAAGEVTFDYSSRSVRPQPKRITPRLGFNPQAFADPGHPPTTLFILYALNESGESAANAAMGVNDAETSFVSGGQTLLRRRFTPDQQGIWRDDGIARGVPHIVLENGTYTEQTLTFSSNLFDLGGTPVTDVELVAIIQVPPGTAVTTRVRNAADSAYVAFTNGQFENADLTLTLIQSKKMQVTLTPNAAGNLSPAIRKFGRQALRRIDLSRVATLEGYEQAFSPETHKVEIPRPRLVAVRDGPKSGPAAFTAKVEKLLAENFINDIRIRWMVGDAALARDKWTHMDDFLVLDSRPRRPVVELQLVGLCALLKDLAPPFSPGTNYAPDGTFSIGSYTDLAGGTTNIHLGIDEAVADETDGIRSGTSPSNQEYIFTLPTPSDIAGRRLFLDVDYAKDQSGGEQIDAKFRVYNGSTLVMETALQAAIGADRVQKTFELSESQIAQLTDLPNLRGACVANAPTPGTGRRLHVYWARFRSGGRREVVTYTNQTPKAVFDDLLANRLAIPANLRGPGIENTTDTISKQITGLRKRSPGAKDVVAKTEVEAVAFIADMAIGSSEGRIKAFDLSPGQPIRAFFPSRRISIGEASPGLERRIPEYFGGYRWDATKEEFKDEVRAFHSASILKIGTLGLGPPKWWDEEIGKWIDTDAVAERLARRVVDRLGTGEMLWSWDSSDRYHELEVGDLVAVETDLFVSRDPNLDLEVRGRRWAIGPLQRVGKGRFFTIHPRGYADILSSAQLASRLGFAVPDLYELTPNVSQTGVATAVFKASGAGSVKYAVSTSAEPTAATVRAATPQALDSDGIFRSSTLATLTAGQSLFIAAFAYERGAGDGAESKLATAKITHYEGGVTIEAVEKSRTSYQVTYLLTARDADGDTVKIHYRTVVTGSPSESYTSPAPTSEGGFSAQPHNLEITLDRPVSVAGGGGGDRYLECWAEDVNANKGPISRLLIPTIATADLETALSGITVTPSFTSCTGPGTGNLIDDIAWTKNCPSAWAVRLSQCQGSGCALPGTTLADPATSGYDHNFGPGFQSGTGGTGSPMRRKYRIRVVNAYGETVDTDDTTEIVTSYADCN